jgi:hypothetical protein
MDRVKRALEWVEEGRLQQGVDVAQDLLYRTRKLARTQCGHHTALGANEQGSSKLSRKRVSMPLTAGCVNPDALRLG